MIYKFKTKPYKHQVAALRRLLKLQFGGALLMDPRTGKTKVCIDFASILYQADKLSRVLVVCPVSVIDVWIDEIKMHCPAKYRITIWDKEGRKAVALPRYGTEYLDFVIINYDAFSTPGEIIGKLPDGSPKRSKKNGGRFDVVRKLKAWQPNLIILDESHRIKSPSAKKTMAVQRLGKVAEYKILSTGTAVTKKKRVFDLYSQWKFMKPDSPLIAEHTSLSFKKKYGVWIDKNGYPQWLGERNQKTLHRLVHADSFAVTRDECFDLPANFPPQIIHVPLEESRKVYIDMAEEMIAKIKTGEITEASIKLVLNLRLCQITSGIARTAPSEKYPKGRLVRIGQEKLRILDDLFEDWFEQEEKLVVCARFRADLASISKLAREHKVVPQLIYGGQKRRDRTKNIETFRNRSGPAVMIMNPQAGALGIDLRTASTMIWYSLTSSYVDYTQAKDRIALSGKANRFVYLHCTGTYDETQYEVLQGDDMAVKEIMASPEILLRGFK
ncbi:MAG: hypothetical protein DMF62_04705 [Acidobacteria bacterium]|nr:MAG: hypothetical protein DMF62_04705 [Acidobacteriota bacterium]